MCAALPALSPWDVLLQEVQQVTGAPAVHAAFAFAFAFAAPSLLGRWRWRWLGLGLGGGREWRGWSGEREKEIKREGEFIF